MKEEHGLQFFESRMLRNVFGSKMGRMTWEWRKLHNQKHYDLFSSPIAIRVIKTEKNEMDMACSTYGGEESCIQGFVEETGGKETFWKT